MLELGCGRGDLLAAIEPSYGVGVDFGAGPSHARANCTPTYISQATSRSGDLSAVEGPFHYIVIADTIGMFEDIDCAYRRVHQCVHAVDADHHLLLFPLWEPILKLAEVLRFQSRQPKINYVATADFLNLIHLADFEVVSREQRQLMPGAGSDLVRSSIALSLPFPGFVSSACVPISSPGRRSFRPDIFSKHPHSLPQ